MPTVNILDAFGYKWGQTGTVEPITDDQWKLGWAFIGATPPSVEQFNKWGQVFDEKSNYLYAQMKAVFDAAGEVPDPADLNSLRDSLQVLVGGGRLLRTLVYSRVAGVQNVSINGGAPTTSGAGSYTPTAGISFADFEVQGGGSGGSGATGATGGNASLGAPGCAGAYARAFLSAATLGVGAISITVGLGSAGGVGGASLVGGTSSVGAHVTAPGGTAANTLTNQSPPTANGNSVPSVAPTGGNVVSVQGYSPNVSIAQSATTAISGAGGPGLFGPGSSGQTYNTNAIAATNPGSGGGGVVVNSGGGTATGGAGAAGIIIIREYA